MSHHQHTEPRATCYRCMKPAVSCICNEIARVDNQTTIYIVQHMRERRHAIGTAQIAALGLNRFNQETIFPTKGCFQSRIDFPKKSALLYLGPDAVSLEHLAPHERPRHLVVIDGTWPQASKIYRDSPNLQALPCVTFETVQSSNYRIRQEPSNAANATIEAICRALQILEPRTENIQSLLTCFDQMIDRQIHASAKRNRRIVHYPKPHKPKKIPKSLRQKGIRLVLACGERAPNDTSSKGRLWSWNALRLNDHVPFRAVITEANQIATNDIGIPVNTFRTEWQQYMDKNDVLITWNNKTLGRLFDVIGPHPHFVSLKAAFGNLRLGACQTLTAAAEKAAVPLPSLPVDMFNPHTQTILKQMAAVVSFLQRYQP